METSPIISVITPVYNAKDYIDALVASVLAQSFSDFELILVDDGSTDGSGEVCDKYKDNEKIRVIHSENRGAAGARNLGVKNANGSYIAFADSDDTLSEGYLEYLYKLITDNDADISICGYKKIYPGSIEEDVKKIPDKFIIMSGTEAMERLLYQKDLMSVPWGSLSKKSIWNQVSFPEGTRAEDVGTIYKLYSLANKVVFGNSPLYNYYQRATNTIYSTSYIKNKDYYKHSRNMIEYVKEKYPGSLSAAYSRHFSTCFQILSESNNKQEYKTLVKQVYKDIKELRVHVLKDKCSRSINRGSAMLSLVSIRLLHFVLRLYYSTKKRKL